MITIEIKYLEILFKVKFSHEAKLETAMSLKNFATGDSGLDLNQQEIAFRKEQIIEIDCLILQYFRQHLKS